MRLIRPQVAVSSIAVQQWLRFSTCACELYRASTAMRTAGPKLGVKRSHQLHKDMANGCTMQHRADWLCLLSPTKSMLTLLRLVAALTGVKASSCWCLAVSVWPLR